MKQKTIGVIIGKFLPIHNGHLYLINKSATQVDKLYVIVDEHPESDRKKCEEAGIKYPDLLTRTKWMTSIYKDTPHIEVVAMSEEGIPTYPDGWQAWSDKVRETVGEPFTHIFTSDAEYKDGYAKYFPEVTAVFYDNDRKSTNGISATKVRNNIYKYWASMPSVVRSFFTKKYVIVGAESVGKTTLVKAMAKIFNTSWAEEYGRTFCEKELGKWYDKNQFILTDKGDYETIVTRQEAYNAHAIYTANKFALIDTDAIYTQFFYETQFKNKSQLVEDYIKKQKEDFTYIYLSNEVDFVDDGMRLNNTSKTIEQYYLNYIGKFDYVVTGKTYEERFDKLFNILKSESEVK